MRRAREAVSFGPRPVGRLSWYLAEVRGGHTVFARRLPEDLPLEAHRERQYCVAHGIKSNVTIPLKAGGSVLGADRV